MCPGQRPENANAGTRKKPYKKLGMVVAVMAFAGFTAGLLGIGGALIFNPVLLQLGVQPQVSFILQHMLHVSPIFSHPRPCISLLLFPFLLLQLGFAKSCQPFGRPPADCD